MTIPEQAVAEQFPLDAEADIRMFNRVLAAITKSCTSGSLYHPEQATRDVMEIIRSLTPQSLGGVKCTEDVARKKLNFLIEEIIDREGREGLSDYDFAEQVIALAQRAREEMTEAAAVLALPHTGQPQEGEAERIVEHELGSIEVDARGSCKWTDVANAMTHVKAQLRRLSAAPASPQRAEGANPLAEFARWVISEGPFEGCHLDGADIQNKAEQLGLIIKTKYDPAIHGESDCAEPGDDWYLFAPPVIAEPKPIVADKSQS